MMKEKLKLTEVWFKLILLAGFIYFYLGAVDYPPRSKQFPQLIAAITIILLVISLIMDFAQKNKKEMVIGDADDTELKVIDDESRKLRRKRFIRAWAIVLVSIACGFLGGFLFSTFFLFLGFALIFGKRENLLRNIAVGIGMTVAVYIVFDFLMGVPLLEGMLFDLS